MGLHERWRPTAGAPDEVEGRADADGDHRPEAIAVLVDPMLLATTTDGQEQQVGVLGLHPSGYLRSELRVVHDGGYGAADAGDVHAVALGRRLCRPDGHVGAATQPADSPTRLARHLPQADP